MQRPKSCLLLFSDAKNTEDYCSVHNSINEIHEFREEKDEKFLGRHFGCRPLDPTLDIWSNFVHFSHLTFCPKLVI